jgi:hypothetical protein
MAAAVGAAAASPAQAAPTNCSTGTSGPTIAWAQCNSGTGQYYVRTYCSPFGGWQNGPWRTPNGISYADCGWRLATNITLVAIGPV